jgi:hypothetical protein
MKIESNQIQIQKTPKFFKVSFIIGIIAAIASVACLKCSPKQFYFSALTAGTFWVGISLGALFFTLIHHLVSAQWSGTVRRVSEMIGTIVPYTSILLGIVLLCGMHELFEWSHPEAVQADHLLQKKQAYLNVNFFTVRLVIYIAIWTFLTFFFYKDSVKSDQGSQDASMDKPKTMAPAGIIMFAITVTFAAFDWLMSLDPHWYSTIFGAYVFAGFVASFFAFIILLYLLLFKLGYLQGIVTREHMHDLGKLMFAFVCFWAFMATSQYILIWYGNIPEETIFYAHRWDGWKWISLSLPIGHFAIPFLFLMSREIKRNYTTLAIAAVWVLLIHFVDLHWLVLPNLHHGFHPSFQDLTTFVAFGGIFLGLLGKRLTKAPLVPVNDPYLEKSINHVSR